MKTAAVICIVAASVFIASPVRAALHDHTLDQYNGFPDNEAVPLTGYGVGGTTMMAQTFTVGLPGILCHVEIGNTTPYAVWGTPAPPVVEIWSTVEEAGLFRPGSSLASVPLSDPVPYDGWTPLIDFTPYNILVEPGQMYAIVLGAKDQTGAVSVGATSSEFYDRGALWTWGIWDGGTEETWGSLSGSDTGVYDMQFRTYVVPVPLPAGVWLGICAVSVGGWYLKRQKA